MRLSVPSISKASEYAGYVLLSSAVILYGFFSGLNISSRTVEAFFVAVEVVFIDAVSSSIFFTVFLGITGLLLLKELYVGKDLVRVTDSGQVVVVIPVYRDGNVLENSVESLNNSNYNDLRIVVVCEEDDEESLRVAEGLDCEVIVNKHPGSKAGAINTAFEEFDGEYFAIFDADEMIDPDFIPYSIGSIEQGFDAFQGRRIPVPSGIVEGFAYCERVLFHSAYKISELSGFRNLRSSSTVMKRDVWERVEGYEDLLTEDLDFPHKCFRSGIRIKQDRRTTNLMEAPHTWRDFWNQRKRWRMGQIQVLHKALKGGYPNNFSYRGLVSLARLVFSVVVGFLILTMIPKFLILFILGFEIIFLLPLATSVILVLLVSRYDMRGGKTEFIGWKALLTPFVFIATGFLAVKSLLEYIVTWEGEWYDVQKTGE